MKRVAIIQARMGSTRLPGKILADVGGETMLARVVARCRRAPLLDEIIVATTTGPADDATVAECRRLEVAVFRGDANDVLERFYRAANYYSADVIVRITSDCPLLQPEIIDQVVEALITAQ